jgi:hypothetical protein
MYFVLSAFTSSPISLVATTKASAFSFTVYHYSSTFFKFTTCADTSTTDRAMLLFYLCVSETQCDDIYTLPPRYGLFYEQM